MTSLHEINTWSLLLAIWDIDFGKLISNSNILAQNQYFLEIVADAWKINFFFCVEHNEEQPSIKQLVCAYTLLLQRSQEKIIFAPNYQMLQFIRNF